MAAEDALEVPPIDTWIGLVYEMRLRMHMDHQPLHRARATPATARRPAATEPTFLVAAPVKPAGELDPVFDGPTGTIGEPVEPAPPTPEPEPGDPGDPGKPAPVVPVAMGAVPTAKPVDPGTTVELQRWSVKVFMTNNMEIMRSIPSDCGLCAPAHGIIVCRGVRDRVRCGGCDGRSRSS